ncbi:MAG: hypothetical protein GF416_03135 [Candidatus Altiarchaeales archaeon]|nr:hypothetical protein [Candidatus Altiarchaeales archaeon]MBD3416114.1 hypothetical protein [Candidatus Altiarchaeales archaeon]
MAAQAMLIYVAYGATVYLLAYLLYLASRVATLNGGKTCFKPYDRDSLILKRKQF